MIFLCCKSLPTDEGRTLAAFAKIANEVQLWSVIPYAVAAIITGKYSQLRLA